MLLCVYVGGLFVDTVRRNVRKMVLWRVLCRRKLSLVSRKTIKSIIRALNMIYEVSLWPEVSKAMSFMARNIMKSFDTNWLS